jgi:hypothetical protein
MRRRGWLETHIRDVVGLLSHEDTSHVILVLADQRVRPLTTDRHDEKQT